MAHADIAGRRMAIVGLGDSGFAAAALGLARGATVVGLDEGEAESVGRRAAELGIELRSGPLLAGALGGFDLVVVSPGIPPNPAVMAAEAQGVEVVSELELAWRHLDPTIPLVLVGGTNGKSTVTALTGEMLRAAGRDTFVGGNFGEPLCEAVGKPYQALVVEISSFQAERVPTLHARVHVLLNITEDHLDRYPGFAAYAEAKGNPFAVMEADDVAVVPAGDRECARQAARGRAMVVTFGLRAGEGGVGPDEHGDIVDRLRGEVYRGAELRIRGRHNLANACAAIAAAAALGAHPSAIAQALASFTGLAHRNVLVAELSGVRYYDDSKATNVGAAVAALSGLCEARAVLIAGGRDKLGSYAPLVEALRAHGRALVVLGEAADRIAAAAAGVLPIVHASSIGDAVTAAAALARPGDAVLLSPACSSYDMFSSYKARGAAFAAAVLRLEKSK